MSHFMVAVISDGRKTVDGLLMPYMENCCSEPPLCFMEFYDDDECDVDERTGRRGYWQNPNAKWDWYDESGGRFRERAAELVGGNPVKVSEIEFDAEAHRRLAEETWDANVGEDGKPAGWFAWNVVEGTTRDMYVEQMSHLSFRAVVTPDGEWHEVGEMGWWGISSESADEMHEWRIRFAERFIEPYQDCMLTVVDCHI